MTKPIEPIEKVAIVFLTCATFLMISIAIVFLHDAYSNYSNSNAVHIYKEQECLK